MLIKSLVYAIHFSSQVLLLVFLNVWISTLPNYYSCISRPLIYAHQIINSWNSFFKPSAASSLSQYVWISTLPNYYSCISRPLIYAHQIISLWNSFFKPRAASSLSQYVWISTLPNYYSCISRPLIYAHQIIHGIHFSSQGLHLVFLNMFEFQPYKFITRA